jgi:DNA-binding HxlR family transcriptional regulator
MSKQLPDCPVEIALMMIGTKWKVLILRELATGTKRFSELKHGIHGVTQKMLTQQLRDMEEDGLVIRTVYPVVPPKVEYRLSDTGKTLQPVLDALHHWGEDYRALCDKKALKENDE